MIAALLALTVAATPADSTTRRVALLVAHPFGGDELTPLRYTGNDVGRMREALRLAGGFADDDIVTIEAKDANAVRDRFRGIKKRLENEQRTTLFLFYYSGHAKDGELRLGETRLPLTEVKKLLESSGASLRIALLDACRVGSITRLKGASVGEPVNIEIDDSTAQSGQILITASSDDEDAQESDEIQGSFFTHYLTSGLRGAADGDRDGRVTLSEAYGYAYDNTVARTVATRGGTQHPTFRFDMRGAGDVTLARTDTITSGITLPSKAAGDFVVFDSRHRIVVAELSKEAGSATNVGVAPGEYVVKKREVDHVLLTRVTVRSSAFAPVDMDRMQKVAFADDYAKGATITAEQVRKGKLGVLLSAEIGAQTFLSSPIRDAYLPTMGLLRLSLDLRNLVTKNVGVRFDIGLGGSGNEGVAIRDPQLGELGANANVDVLTTGVALTGELPLNSWLRLGGATRIGFIRLNREFTDNSLPTQTFSTLTPGLTGRLTARCTDWLEAGLGLGVHYMFFNGDESQSLAYIDGGVIVSAVLK